jgi:SAM-dependent methyltransferase
VNDESVARQSRVRATWDTVAADYATAITGLSAESPLELAFLDRFAAEQARMGRVADIGCGPGRITAYLASKGVDAYGIDLSPRMVDIATASYPHLHFEVGTLTQLKIGDHALAGVLAWYCLVSTLSEELPEVFAEFARVLRPGGGLLLGIQVGVGVVQITQSFGHEVDSVMQLLAVDDVAALLARAGFRVDATLVREAVGSERRAQGFLLARKA